MHNVGTFQPTIVAKAGVELGMMMWQRKYMRLLLMPAGITGFLVISLVSLLSYIPNTSVPFPYVEPPFKGYHMEITTMQLITAFLSQYTYLSVPESLTGESLIFKNVKFKEWPELWKTETYITDGFIAFFALNPQELENLKKNDVVDIVGVVVGVNQEVFHQEGILAGVKGWEEYPLYIIVKDCQFLPAGVAPLPLPGGPVVVIGY